MKWMTGHKGVEFIIHDGVEGIDHDLCVAQNAREYRVK